MIKKFLILFCFFLLSNCSAPGTVFLGPIFTGAKTGSVYQASLSYTSNKIIEEIKLKSETSKFSKFNKKNQIKQIVSNAPYTEKNPTILLTYKVNKIDISEVYEPEPLP